MNIRKVPATPYLRHLLFLDAIASPALNPDLSWSLIHSPTSTKNQIKSDFSKKKLLTLKSKRGSFVHHSKEHPFCRKKYRFFARMTFIFLVNFFRLGFSSTFKLQYMNLSVDLPSGIISLLKMKKCYWSVQGDKCEPLLTNISAFDPKSEISFGVDLT